MKKEKKEVSLTPSQQQKLEEWNEKIKNGEVHKEIKKILKEATLNIHPEAKFDNLAKNIIPKHRYLGEKLAKEEEDEYSKALIDYGLDNDSSVIGLINENYRGMIVNLRRELIKEFNCNTYSEKVLVDVIINAYARNLYYSKKFISVAELGSATSILNGYMGVLSKEIDRANRHLITAIEVLKQIKQPELKVNVKTNTAFISQNQQFNNQTNEAK